MNDKIENFANRLFAPIGRFVVQFENVCEALRSGGTRIFANAGLQKQELAELTFAGLTASPLLDVFVSLVSEAFDLTEPQHETVKDLRKRAQELIAIRNRAIHSTWYLIDFADIENGAPDGVLINKRRKQTRLDTRTTSLNRDQLNSLCDDATALTNDIRDFVNSLVEPVQ